MSDIESPRTLSNYRKVLTKYGFFKLSCCVYVDYQVGGAFFINPCAMCMFVGASVCYLSHSCMQYMGGRQRGECVWFF